LFCPGFFTAVEVFRTEPLRELFAAEKLGDSREDSLILKGRLIGQRGGLFGSSRSGSAE
jgi:hypothetical protein